MIYEYAEARLDSCLYACTRETNQFNYSLRVVCETRDRSMIYQFIIEVNTVRNLVFVYFPISLNKYQYGPWGHLRSFAAI